MRKSDQYPALTTKSVQSQYANPALSKFIVAIHVRGNGLRYAEHATPNLYSTAGDKGQDQIAHL